VNLKNHGRHITSKFPLKGTPKIMIISGKTEFVNSINEFFSAEKCTLLHAATPDTSVKIIETEPVDIVIFDLSTKQHDMLRRQIKIFKQIQPDIEIIIILARAVFDKIFDMPNDWIHHLLIKPVDLSLLYVTVLTALERKRMITEIREYQEKLEKKVVERTSELKNVQERLVQSEKLAALGQSLAGIVHEINNPLCVIYGRTQLLLMQTNIPETILRNIRIIEDQVHKTKNITNRILKFSKPARPKFERVDIVSLVNDIIVLLDYEFSTQNIKVVKNFHTDHAFVFCDADQIQEAITNIMTNAKQAMPGGGELSLEIFIKGDHANIIIADTGAGIKQENIGKLFDPFFTTKSEGTGLGLPICYGIIREHSGDIFVKSRIDIGSEFTISLPLM